MKLPTQLARLLMSATLASVGPTLLSASAVTVSGDPLKGSGNVNRSVLTYGELFSNTAPGFAVPASAAAPSETFEGTLTLSNPPSTGSFRVLRDDAKMDTGTDSPWR